MVARRGAASHVVVRREWPAHAATIEIGATGRAAIVVDGPAPPDAARAVAEGILAELPNVTLGSLRDVVARAPRYLAALDPGARVALSVAVAVSSNGRLAIAHIGDCRAYLLRERLPAQLLISEHTTAEASCRLAGKVLAGARRVRTRVLTFGTVAHGVDAVEVETVGSDVVVLCSGGVWETLDDHLLGARIHGPGTFEEACTSLTAGGKDNGAVAIFSSSSRLRAPAGARPNLVTPPTGVLDLGRLHADAGATEIVPRTGPLTRLRHSLVRPRGGKVLLSGRHGAGKSSLLKLLAAFLGDARNRGPFRRLWVIDVLLVASGVRQRGDVEARLEKLLEAPEDVALALDDVHLALHGPHAPEVAAALGGFLARSTSPMVITIDAAAVDRLAGAYPALFSRLERHDLEPADDALAVAILRSAVPALEAHFGCAIDAEVAPAAVEIARRFVPDQALPASAIDLLELACARIGQAGRLTWSPLSTGTSHVTRHEVIQAVSEQKGIPLPVLLADGGRRLEDLQRALTERIVGQAEAIRTVATTLRLAHEGFRTDPRRPLASFLFLGPTGVGKTETAKVMGRTLFGDEAAVITLDMSELKDPQAAARLTGALPGYVGYGEGGLLTRAMRHRPASVVLFDEVEKAHPSVLDLLLQILDEGRLTDHEGGRATFHDAIVVLTSNLTIETGAAGFVRAGPDTRKTDEAKLRRTLERHLRPELVGRIDRVVRFAALDRNSATQVALARLEQVGRQVGSLPSAVRATALGAAGAAAGGAREVIQNVNRIVGDWLLEREAPAEPAPAPRLRYRPREHRPGTGIKLVIACGSDEISERLFQIVVIDASTEGALLLVEEHPGRVTVTLEGRERADELTKRLLEEWPDVTVTVS